MTKLNSLQPEVLYRNKHAYCLLTAKAAHQPESQFSCIEKRTILMPWNRVCSTWILQLSPATNQKTFSKKDHNRRCRVWFCYAVQWGGGGVSWLAQSKTIDDALALINQFTTGWQKNESVTWGLYQKGHTDLIGTLNCWQIQKQHYRAEIGYRLQRSLQGKGYRARPWELWWITDFRLCSLI